MEIETWIKDIIVLILEKRAIQKLEGQTRRMCILECVGTVVLWMFDDFDGQ